jgi:hypothetical protein
VRGRSRYKRHRYRAEKMRALTRHVDFLEAERRRLEVLLGEAYRYGAHHSGVSSGSLLGVLAETRRINLARPAWIEEGDKQKLANLLDLLERGRSAAA